jgi:Heterokaryon incompatibility protein (HET)
MRLEVSIPDLASCSETCLSLIGKWIGNCKKSHECGQYTTFKDNQNGRSNYPTRLLFVGTVQKPTLQLEETINFPRKERYLTLSHCWGGLDFFKLTDTNYTQLCKQIPENQLTKTFKDTITLTRKLDVRYLWIDSLCIIQGNQEDWKYEAGRMLQVYRNSYCTIAATGSRNGLQGLFYERSDPVICPPVITVGNLNQKKPQVSDEFDVGINVALLTSDARNFYIADMDLWTNQITHSPLGVRAWCLQERVLSPRTIHFGQKQILYECQNLQACSSFPTKVPNGAIPSREAKHNFSLESIAPSASVESIKFQALKMWKNFVTTYSSCKLTHYSDKLIAIGGLASRVAEHLPDTRYLAGLWDYELLHLLLWYIVDFDPGFGPGHRPKEYQAPSWSWASVNHSVKFLEISDDESMMATFHSADIELKDSISFGQVAKGSINLMALVIPVRIAISVGNQSSFDDRFEYVLQLEGTKVVMDPVWDCYPGLYDKDFFCVPMLKYKDGGIVGLVVGRPAKEDGSREEEADIQDQAEEGSKSGAIWIQDEYERLGFFRLSLFEWFHWYRALAATGKSLCEIGSSQAGQADILSGTVTEKAREIQSDIFKEDEVKNDFDFYAKLHFESFIII